MSAPFPSSNYNLSLPNRMISAAGWDPQDCDISQHGDLVRITHIPTGQIRQWDKSRDKHPDRDLGVAP